jgi:biopolymer transport protein TolR
MASPKTSRPVPSWGVEVAGGLSSGRHGRRARRAGTYEINVTPLIDVMLVLLVIFMVTAPMLTTGVKVDLPKAKTSAMQVDGAKMLVTITRDDRVFLEKDQVVGDLAASFKANARVQAEHELYVQADENVRYGTVLRVMAAAREAGVDKLGMVTDPLTVQ